MANPHPKTDHLNKFKPGQSGNPGGKPKNAQRFDYWYTQFKNMTVKEFRDYEKSKPDEQRTVAESVAYAAVIKARNDLKFLREVADRTEGRPILRTDITSGGDKIEPIVIYRPEKLDEDKEEE